MGLGMWPVGMYILEAFWSIFRSWDSPELAEEGGPSWATASSTIRVKESQSALRRLVYGMRGAWGDSKEKVPPRWRIIGRWSELREVMVVKAKSGAISGVAIARSGDEGEP